MARHTTCLQHPCYDVGCYHWWFIALVRRPWSKTFIRAWCLSLALYSLSGCACCTFYDGGSVVDLVLLPMFVGYCVWFLFCYARLSIHSSFAEEERESWLLYFAAIWMCVLCVSSLWCIGLQWRSRNAEKLRTSKGDYLINQWFSSIAFLFKMGTSLKGNNLLPE